MLFLMALKLQSVNQSRLSCAGKSAATPRHFTRRYCFCQYLFIIDDYFPDFSMWWEIYPPFSNPFLFQTKKIKIIKFKMMTEHIAAFFFQTSGRLKAWRASRHSRGASGPRKKILWAGMASFPVFIAIFPPKSNVSSSLTKWIQTTSSIKSFCAPWPWPEPLSCPPCF